jgi:phosphoribosylcarboxyaminoimidazole (NCAIR) mutase
MAIGRGGAQNAAVFAAQILALKYSDIATRLDQYKESLKSRAKGLEQD